MATEAHKVAPSTSSSKMPRRQLSKRSTGGGNFKPQGCRQQWSDNVVAVAVALKVAGTSPVPSH